ncbi:MAG TPA: hypothetical protein VJN71_03590, partial [Nitrososphaerales archaeon]|nr:hypothetical protein [Nitrososphaerales archaeon]
IYPSVIQDALMNFPEVIDYLVTIDKSKPAYYFEIKIELTDSLGERNNDILFKISQELERVLFARPDILIVERGTLPRYEGKSKRIIVRT